MLVLQHLIARLNWFVIFAKLKPFYKISSNFLSLWRIISSYCCYLPMNLPHSLFKTLVYFLKFIIGKNARLICMIYILYFCALITKVRCPSFFLTASATWPVPSIADTYQCHIHYIDYSKCITSCLSTLNYICHTSAFFISESISLWNVQLTRVTMDLHFRSFTDFIIVPFVPKNRSCICNKKISGPKTDCWVHSLPPPHLFLLSPKYIH